MTLELAGQKRSPAYVTWEREQQEIQHKRAAQILAPARQALIAANREKADIWRRTPLEKWTTINDLEYLSSVTPDITGLEIAPDGFFDDPEAATAAGLAAKTVLDEFTRTLTQRRGVVLSIPDQKKFRLLVSCLIRTRDVLVTDGNLNRIFDWTMQGETIYQDFGFDADLVVREPEPETVPTVNEVLKTTDTSTREGNALLKKVVDHQWMAELSPLISEWYQSLASEWAISVTKEDAQYLFGPDGWFTRMGLPITAPNLNAARRHQANRGVWAGAVTSQEFLDSQLTRGEIDRPTYMFTVNQVHRAGLLDRPLSEAKAKGIL